MSQYRTVCLGTGTPSSMDSLFKVRASQPMALIFFLDGERLPKLFGGNACPRPGLLSAALPFVKLCPEILEGLHH